MSQEESKDEYCGCCNTSACDTPEGIVKKYPIFAFTFWLCNICAHTHIGNVANSMAISGRTPQNADVLKAIAEVGNMILKAIKNSNQGKAP